MAGRKLDDIVTFTMWRRKRAYTLTHTLARTHNTRTQPAVALTLCLFLGWHSLGPEHSNVKLSSRFYRLYPHTRARARTHNLARVCYVRSISITLHDLMDCGVSSVFDTVKWQTNCIVILWLLEFSIQTEVWHVDLRLFRTLSQL